MDLCVYDSRQSAYKTPFGAVPAGTELCFHLHMPKNIAAESVLLILNSGYTTVPADQPLPKAVIRVEPYFLNKPAAAQERQQQCPMLLSATEADYNAYSVCFVPPEPQLYFYYFAFTEHGVYKVIKQNHQQLGVIGNDFGDAWQLTVYDAAMKTPACFGKGILYQIFPDRFSNSGSPKKNVPPDRRLRQDWGNLPEYLPNANGEVTNSDYFGGDLKGIEEKLPYLCSLGVSCLYLNPIFEAHSNHRYNTADYNHIDPLLGSDEDFASLCQKAKAVGISVVLDGVFSHTGSDSIYFNRNGRYGEKQGAYRDPNSPYRSWYSFQRYPDQYDSWWGFLTLPNVTETNPDYLDFICNEKTGVVQKWLGLGASGIRLDVADELPDPFIDRIRKSVKACGEGNCLIGEVWEDASNKVSYSLRRRYLLGNQLDSVMNYPFRNAILSYIRNGAAEEFLKTLTSILENYPPPVLSCLMNSLSTHDTPRAITALVGESMEGKQRPWQAQRHYLSLEDYWRGQILLKLASTLQYFMPGIPCLYYGDEAGLSGYADPFNRCCYPWGHENRELVDWFRLLGKLRASFPFLSDSDFVPVTVTPSLCTYLRESRDGSGARIFVAINRSQQDEFLPVPEQMKGGELFTLCGTLSGTTLCAQSAIIMHVA